MKKILVLNGSLHGSEGNTFILAQKLIAHFNGQFEVDILHLKECDDITKHEQRLRAADGFVFASGVYWQSWSSHAQRFFEQATQWEATDIWLGKPVCTLVTMHSVGGIDIVSRAQTNFTLFGCMIPPMCSLVFSMLSQIAATISNDADIWDETSLPAIAHNFREALLGTHQYKSWTIAENDPTPKLWLK